MEIKGIEFEEPVDNVNDVEDKSGVYVIICIKNSDKVADIGISEYLKRRLQKHKREDCWKDKCPFGYQYVVRYCSINEAKEIEQLLREKFGNDSLCGER